jgi:hypothetical protein
LHPDVSFGAIGGRKIFLDVARDRYFSLEPDAEAALDRAGRSSCSSLDDADVARLLKTGLFTLANEPQSIVAAEIDIPDRELPTWTTSPWHRPLDIAEITFLLLRIRRALKAGALKRIVATLANLRLKAVMPADAERTARLAARFRKARSLVPIAQVCLLDSLALGMWLARRSACPTIVFGA